MVGLVTADCGADFHSRNGGGLLAQTMLASDPDSLLGRDLGQLTTKSFAIFLSEINFVASFRSEPPARSVRKWPRACFLAERAGYV